MLKLLLQKDPQTPNKTATARAVQLDQ